MTAKRYLLSYDSSNANIREDQLGAFVQNNREILQWAFLYPGAYFLKSDLDLPDLKANLGEYLGSVRHVILAVEKTGNRVIDGKLQKGIWRWFSLKRNPDDLTREELESQPEEL